MPTERFFKELAEVKDLFDWKITNEQRVRGVLKDIKPWYRKLFTHPTFYACPITAIYYKKTGKMEDIGEVFRCGMEMNIDLVLVCRIQMAADWGSDIETRKRMLEILGL